MTLPLEPARPRRRVTWLTIVGVVLLPVLIGAVLIGALWNPTSRLDSIRVAVVNNDEPVKVGDQLAPLGRQLTAGLVEGSSEVDSNIDWVVSNPEDAEDGLANGTYQGTIVIPKGFSAAATSTAGKHPEQARISVTTSPDARVFDAAITGQIANTASTTMGRELSKTYLTNVLGGFTTLNTKLGDAAEGADKLATGAKSASSGAAQLADGTAKLSDGATGLAEGTKAVDQGASGLASGSARLADALNGTSGPSLVTGIGQAVDGLHRAAGDIRTQADKAGATPIFDTTFVSAADRAAADSKTNAGALGALAQSAATTAGNADATAGAANSLVTKLEELRDTATDPAQRAELQEAVDQAQNVATGASTTADDVRTIAGRAQNAAQSGAGIAQSAGTVAVYLHGPNGNDGLIVKVPAATKAGLQTIASGIDTAADRMQPLLGGAKQVAGASQQLAAGAQQLAAGSGKVASGAETLASGTAPLASGAKSLQTGVSQLADGTKGLASGLQTATDQVPTYSKDETKDIAAVVSDPVTTHGGGGGDVMGATGIPLLAILALWFGSLATFIALRARAARALVSRASSIRLALRAFVPAAVIGLLQGALVATVAQIAAKYSAEAFLGFLGLAMFAGVVFAAVNQALVAVFGGAGRWVAAIAGVLFFATGIVSTTPQFLTGAAEILPTAAPFHALTVVVTGSGSVGASIGGGIVWLLLSLIATTLAVTRTRSTSARAIRTRAATA